MGTMKMDNNIDFKQIHAPVLDDVNYANNLSEVFENINKNFEILSNNDFVKGENGLSIKCKSISLNDTFKTVLNADTKELVPYTFKQQLKSDILNYFGISNENDEKLKNIEYVVNGIRYKVNVWDNIDKKDMKIHMIYGENSDLQNINDIPLTSLYYMFFDERFSINFLIDLNNESEDNKSVNINDISSIKNLSCVFIFDSNANDGKGGFKIINDVFPSIYYKNGKGFCWRLNGVDTMISAEGIASKEGKPGKNIPAYIVKCTDSYLQSNVNFDIHEITQIYNNSPVRSTNSPIGYYQGTYDTEFIYDVSTREDFFDKYNFNELDNAMCFVSVKNKSSKKNYFGIGAITVDHVNQRLYCTCNRSTSINDLIEELNCDSCEEIKIQNKLLTQKIESTEKTIQELTNKLSALEEFVNSNIGDSNIESTIQELTNRISALEEFVNSNDENSNDESTPENNPENESENTDIEVVDESEI